MKRGTDDASESIAQPFKNSIDKVALAYCGVTASSNPRWATRRSPTPSEAIGNGRSSACRPRRGGASPQSFAGASTQPFADVEDEQQEHVSTGVRTKLTQYSSEGEHSEQSILAVQTGLGCALTRRGRACGGMVPVPQPKRTCYRRHVDRDVAEPTRKLAGLPVTVSARTSHDVRPIAPLEPRRAAASPKQRLCEARSADGAAGAFTIRTRQESQAASEGAALPDGLVGPELSKSSLGTSSPHQRRLVTVPANDGRRSSCLEPEDASGLRAEARRNLMPDQSEASARCGSLGSPSPETMASKWFEAPSQKGSSICATSRGNAIRSGKVFSLSKRPTEKLGTRQASPDWRTPVSGSSTRGCVAKTQNDVSQQDSPIIEVNTGSHGKRSDFTTCTSQGRPKSQRGTAETTKNESQSCVYSQCKTPAKNGSSLSTPSEGLHKQRDGRSATSHSRVDGNDHRRISRTRGVSGVQSLPRSQTGVEPTQLGLTQTNVLSIGVNRSCPTSPLTRSTHPREPILQEQLPSESFQVDYEKHVENRQAGENHASKSRIPLQENVTFRMNGYEGSAFDFVSERRKISKEAGQPLGQGLSALEKLDEQAEFFEKVYRKLQRHHELNQSVQEAETRTLVEGQDRRGSRRESISLTIVREFPNQGLALLPCHRRDSITGIPMTPLNASRKNSLVLPPGALGFQPQRYRRDSSLHRSPRRNSDGSPRDSSHGSTRSSNGTRRNSPHASRSNSRRSSQLQSPVYSRTSSNRVSVSMSGQEAIEDLCQVEGQLSLERDFQRGELIGTGSFGQVFKARHQLSGQVVAVKEIALAGSAGQKEQDIKSERQRLTRELRFCELLQHPTIVRYIGHEIVSLAGDGGVERLYLFLEYCSEGSIQSHYRAFGALSAQLITKYAEQLTEGLSYLHSLAPPVVHRDLKCANLFLTHDADVKIGDFGCSKWLPPEEMQLQEGKNSVVGSVFWMAPEMLRGKGNVTTAVDVWSLGCCFVEMLSAKPPWAEQNINNIFMACRLIAESEKIPCIPDAVPNELSNFVLCCLQRDIALRASAKQLLAHELLQSLGDSDSSGFALSECTESGSEESDAVRSAINFRSASA